MQQQRETSKKSQIQVYGPCKRPFLTPIHIEQRFAWAHSVERWYKPQWDAVLFEMNPVLKLILLMGGLEFGGKRVSSMTQNVSNSVISMVDPSWFGQASHQNTAQNLFFKTKC